MPIKKVGLIEMNYVDTVGNLEPADLEMKQDISGFTVRWDRSMERMAVSSGEWPNRTVAELARESYSSCPDKVILIDEGLELTVREIYEAALRLAGYYKSIGLVAGDVISFQLPNWWEANVINLAAAGLGLVVNPIVPINRDKELSHILQNSRSKLIFIPETYRKHNYQAMLEDLSSRTREKINVVVVRSVKRNDQSFPYFEDILAKYSPIKDLEEVDPNAVKLVMYTSGTTGRPKGVLHTHNTIHADGVKMTSAMGLSKGDSIYTPSPVTHVTGYLWALNQPWLSNLTAVTTDIWDPYKAFDLVRDNNCVLMLGATPFLKGIVQVAKERNETLPALRQYLCGGAAVPPSLIYEAAVTFPNCIPWRNYGATEATTMTRGPADREHLKLGAETDGQLYRCQVKIIDLTTGELAKAPEEGEILVREPSMAVGYVDDADNATAYDSEGFFRMGDIGRVIDENFILITGRKKDLIIRSGENISAKEIEDAMLMHESILDVAVVSQPNEKTGEAIAAFLVTKDNIVLDLNDASEIIARAGLAKQKTPEFMYLMKELPRTASGKVIKEKLRDIAKRGAL